MKQSKDPSAPLVPETRGCGETAVIRLLNPTALTSQGGESDVQTYALDDCTSPLFRTIVSVHHVKAKLFPILRHYYRLWRYRCEFGEVK